MIGKVYRIVLDDRRVNVRGIVDIVGIPNENVHRISTGELGMENTRRGDLLARLRHDPKEFLCRFANVDETWIHHYSRNRRRVQTMDTQRSSAIKESKHDFVSGKRFLGITLIDYLEKEKTTNGEYYANLLQQLSDEI